MSVQAGNLVTLMERYAVPVNSVLASTTARKDRISRLKNNCEKVLGLVILYLHR